jgi:hypothetical protein
MSCGVHPYQPNDCPLCRAAWAITDAELRGRKKHPQRSVASIKGQPRKLSPKAQASARRRTVAWRERQRVLAPAKEPRAVVQPRATRRAG